MSLAIVFYSQDLLRFLSSWASETTILHIVLCWIVSGSLCLLLTFRFATIVKSPRALIESFDILACTPPSGIKPTSFEKLFGRTIWREQFEGELLAIRSLRGISFLVLLVAVIFYILSSVIFEPLRETALQPIKELRASFIPDGISVATVAWDIIVPLNTTAGDNATDIMVESVSLDQLWSKEAQANNEASGFPPCETVDDYAFNGIQFPGFQCFPGEFELPDLLITVNFTTLGQRATVFESATPSINLIISLADRTETGTGILVKSTVPFGLVPGVNLVGTYVIEVRQVFSNHALAALGLFQTSKSFVAARLTGIYPDPSFAVPRGGNISTLRLFSAPFDYSESRIIADQRDNSVVAGFSSVGGLWTTLSGIFAIIFGGSLFYMLNGSKPLTIFGVVHSFQQQTIRRVYTGKYQLITTEQTSPETKGLVALLRDHVIDLSLLNKESDPTGAVDSSQVHHRDIEDSPGDEVVGENEKPAVVSVFYRAPKTVLENVYVIFGLPNFPFLAHLLRLPYLTHIELDLSRWAAAGPGWGPAPSGGYPSLPSHPSLPSIPAHTSQHQYPAYTPN
ncbi:hypothetical protein GALMADRAFT_138594 [Galerina marginata CBS 339.88]|uniref:Uncharacterized protein n=1 Tax=Galerina marginata (strain CBS 339.88) TaxID=685588 RepID=A0A067T2V2_GALM3|nr:hypothetical protein GALMADRAFT_138594 [Galerina marginata CBS 339.88]